MHPHPTCHKKHQFDVSFSYPPSHPRNVKRGNENYFFGTRKFIGTKVLLEQENTEGSLYVLSRMQKYKWNVTNIVLKSRT